MLLALALIAQEVQLEAGDHEAALTCAAALRANVARPTVEQVLPALYFIVLAASEGDPATMKERMVPMTLAAADRTAAIKDKAGALVDRCRQRFPLAWKSTPAALPANRFQRAVMCTVTSASYFGMVRDGKVEAPPGEAARAEARFERFTALVTPGLASANGVRSADQIPAAFSRAFTASLKLGNLQGILSACEIAYPG
jgi:hypothetical protein